MALENLKKNIRLEKQIILEILALDEELKKTSNPEHKQELSKAREAKVNQIRILNNSIPSILNAISVFKKLDEKEKKADNLAKVNYSGKNEIMATVSNTDKEKFLEELEIGDKAIDRLKKVKEKTPEVFGELRRNFYSTIANYFFRNLSNEILQEGSFKELEEDIRKARINYLITSYISIMFFTTILALILGLSLGIYFSLGSDAIIWFRNLGISLVIPILTFMGFYYYPVTEAKNLSKKIDEELPFAALNMAAIAGSGIEPSKIFKIIVESKEYGVIKKELTKIVNLVNFYGYDLVSSLKNTAKESPSKKLADLLNGMASSISGGTGLKDFLEKRAETLFFEYKLAKEKYTKVVETMMDIYISIMIAAPMILTLLLVLLNVSNINIGLSLNAMTAILLLIVGFINIVFIIFINIKQPSND